MASRALLLLRLAHAAPGSRQRAKLITQFRATGDPQRLGYKIDDFVRRRFLTTGVVETMQLTKDGRDALARADVMDAQS